MTEYENWKKGFDNQITMIQALNLKEGLAKAHRCPSWVWLPWVFDDLTLLWGAWVAVDQPVGGRYPKRGSDEQRCCDPNPELVSPLDAGGVGIDHCEITVKDPRYENAASGEGIHVRAIGRIQRGQQLCTG